MGRIGLVLAALLGALALTGCQPPEDAAPPPAPAGPDAPPPVAQQDLGTTGLDIRYLDADGQLKTLRVRDFPR